MISYTLRLSVLSLLLLGFGADAAKLSCQSWCYLQATASNEQLNSSTFHPSELSRDGLAVRGFRTIAQLPRFTIPILDFNYKADKQSHQPIRKGALKLVNVGVWLSLPCTKDIDTELWVVTKAPTVYVANCPLVTTLVLPATHVKSLTYVSIYGNSALREIDNLPLLMDANTDLRVTIRDNNELKCSVLCQLLERKYRQRLAYISKTVCVTNDGQKRTFTTINKETDCQPELQSSPPPAGAGLEPATDVSAPALTINVDSIETLCAGLINSQRNPLTTTGSATTSPRLDLESNNVVPSNSDEDGRCGEDLASMRTEYVAMREELRQTSAIIMSNVGRLLFELQEKFDALEIQ